MPLPITAPRSICERNFAGTARRPFESIVCSYSPRNISKLTLSPTTGHNGGPWEVLQDVLPHLTHFTDFPHPPFRLTNFPHFSPLHCNIYLPLGERVLSTNFFSYGG